MFLFKFNNKDSVTTSIEVVLSVFIAEVVYVFAHRVLSNFLRSYVLVKYNLFKVSKEDSSY